MNTKNWFPGHMKKASNKIKDQLSIVDFALVLLDSRAPLSSINRDLLYILNGKPTLIFLNKSDLCDKEETIKWAEYFTRSNTKVIFINSKTKIKADVIAYLKELTYEKRKKALSKGIKNPIFTGMVLGVPNVGKSTFINAIINKKRLNAENRPGVTRNIDTIKIDDQFYLLDTPGILEPKYVNEEQFFNLAIVGSVKKDILDLSEINQYIFKVLHSYYKENFVNFYSRFDVNKCLNYNEFIENLAASYIAKLKNDTLNIDEAEIRFFCDFRDGKITKYTLDRMSKYAE